MFVCVCVCVCVCVFVCVCVCVCERERRGDMWVDEGGSQLLGTSHSTYFGSSVNLTGSLSLLLSGRKSNSSLSLHKINVLVM